MTMESALTKDNTEVSIDEIKAVLLQKLQQIQASHDEIKVMLNPTLIRYLVENMHKSLV